MKKIVVLLLVVAFLGLSSSAYAIAVFQDLGTSAPPSSVGPITVTPFDIAVQNAIPDFTDVTTIPGSPIGGSLTTSISVNKRTIGFGWATWSHGYTGPVYYSNGATSLTMTLPSGTSAFYFYAEPNPFSWVNFVATTNSGVTSGTIAVNGASGANGFGFYTTDAGEYITSITLSADTDFAFGEFGASAGQAEQVSVPTMTEWGMIIFIILAGLGSIYYLRKYKRV